MSDGARQPSPLLATGSVARNRRARFDYHIEEDIEAGLVLTGTEVKSLRCGGVNLSDAYAGPSEEGLTLFNLYIGPYAHAHRLQQHEPKRPRTILLHRRQRDRLLGALRRQGYSLIPLALYFNARGLLKLSLGLGKGKKEVDKRDVVKERDWRRRQGRVLRALG